MGEWGELVSPGPAACAQSRWQQTGCGIADPGVGKGWRSPESRSQAGLWLVSTAPHPLGLGCMCGGVGWRGSLAETTWSTAWDRNWSGVLLQTDTLPGLSARTSLPAESKEPKGSSMHLFWCKVTCSLQPFPWALPLQSHSPQLSPDFHQAYVASPETKG